MAEGTGSAQNTESSKMTIHVYRMTRAGEITEDRGTVEVPDAPGPVPMTDAFRPCECRWCQPVQS